jgi:hypothetical protein
MTQEQIMSLCRMVWTPKGNLHYLIDILKERGYILVKKELYDLFKDPYNCPDVRWNGDKLEYLALLIYRLCNEGFITLKVNKGNFSFAERHFTDFAGNKMKKKSLKNLCSKVNVEKDSYAHVHEEIDEIINAISKKQK